MADDARLAELRGLLAEALTRCCEAAEELHRARAAALTPAVADIYAGIAGMTVGTDDGLIVLDLSTPEQPEHTRLRIERQTALDLCDQIMDAVDVLDGGRWW